MKIAFYSPHLCLRGTTVAIYDYANFNQVLLGNESIIIYDELDVRNDASVVEKFSKSFKTISLKTSRHMFSVDRVLDREKADAVYVIKGGSPNDGLLSETTRSLIHVTGMAKPENRHGSVWAYVSYFLKKACSYGRRNTCSTSHRSFA